MNLIYLREVPEAHTAFLGALVGDIVGSRPTPHKITSLDFPLFSEKSKFTDDSVLTIAVAFALWKYGRNNLAAIEDCLVNFFRRYPGRGYGKGFAAWCTDEGRTDSFANGAAMRVSSAGYIAKSFEQALELAKHTALPTHNNPVAIAAAQSIALAIQASVCGMSKDKIAEAVDEIFHGCGIKNVATMKSSDYDALYGKEAFSKAFAFPSVPQTLACFFESHDAENAIRRAVACDKDKDTQGSMAAAIAFPFYRRIPKEFIENLPPLPEEFVEIIIMFSETYDVPKLELI